MIDDLKGERRLRIDEATMCVAGLCYHARHYVNLQLRSVDDCYSIKDGIKKNNFHYSTEITNIAIAPIREHEYQPIF